nr:LPXTG cell wall anchor domain-containing protein [Streptococcus dysgalactiae]WCE85431.1 LPXTG cell wall anchor domain-containing protein [Streptococcus dysgalactiae]WCN25430.1 LPXTG cell wall anchor domain-containing protein [Streptococcus dysgalactiae]
MKADANAKNAEYIRILGLKAEQDKAEAEAKRLQALKDKADAKVTPISTQAGVTQVGDQISYSRVEKYKSLPNTGSQESLLGLLGASMLLGLGYTGKRRRKN